MRYEFEIDEIKVPALIGGTKVEIDMVAEIKVAVEVSRDGEVHSPTVQWSGKWQIAKEWLAAAIVETASGTWHLSKIDDMLAERVPAFDPVREWGTYRAEAL